jgi:hypothetical protein
MSVAQCGASQIVVLAWWGPLVSDSVGSIRNSNRFLGY